MQALTGLHPFIRRGPEAFFWQGTLPIRNKADSYCRETAHFFKRAVLVREAADALLDEAERFAVFTLRDRCKITVR